MGYQQDKYNQDQTAKAEAQDRVNAYLAAYGNVADLDPSLIRNSGYTQSELDTIARYYADQRAQEQAAAAKKNTGGGTGGGGNTTQKPTLTAAQTLTALENGIVNDQTLAAYEYYFGEPWRDTSIPVQLPTPTAGTLPSTVATIPSSVRLNDAINTPLSTDEWITIRNNATSYLQQGDKESLVKYMDPILDKLSQDQMNAFYRLLRTYGYV